MEILTGITIFLCYALGVTINGFIYTVMKKGGESKLILKIAFIIGIIPLATCLLLMFYSCFTSIAKCIMEAGEEYRRLFNEK